MSQHLFFLYQQYKDIEFHMKYLTHILLPSLTLLLPLTLFSQNAGDYGLFMDASREHSVLYRGTLPMRYGYLMPTDASTFFAYSMDFEQGEVVFRGKRYKNVLLNLNAHKDELYVKDPVNGLPILVNKNFVTSFTMGTHPFICMNDEYYEQLYAGRLILFKKIQKRVHETINSDDKIVRKYLLLERFYLVKNDQWYQVNTKKELKQLFPEHKKVIYKLFRSKGLVATVAYLDSI